MLILSNWAKNFHPPLPVWDDVTRVRLRRSRNLLFFAQDFSATAFDLGHSICYAWGIECKAIRTWFKGFESRILTILSSAGCRQSILLSWHTSHGPSPCLTHCKWNLCRCSLIKKNSPLTLRRLCLQWAHGMTLFLGLGSLVRLVKFAEVRGSSKDTVSYEVGSAMG